jgi:RHS repeat-associated protein
VWNAESEIKTGGGVNYTYDGDGDRVQKSNGKIYWFGAGSQVLDESDAAGNVTDEYVYFGGKRIAHQVVSTNTLTYYVEDMLGSSRALATSTGTLCYDADFYPYGGEHNYINTCAQNYKFTGKERDPETNNDDFDARYYSSAYGRFLSADWSSTPTPVPYANLTNPQTLNLYAMVSDNPESFADLDGHANFTQSNAAIGACTDSGSPACSQQMATQNATAQSAGTAQNQTLSLTVTSGPKSGNGDTIVQSPTILTMSLTSNPPLPPGSYKVAVTVTKDTDDAQDGQAAVKAAQISVRVDNVGTSNAKLGGTETGPPGASKITMQVGFSAKNDDFHYEGPANINVTISRPDGWKAAGSTPVDVQKGNPGSPSVLGVTGGKDQFTVQ